MMFNCRFNYVAWLSELFFFAGMSLIMMKLFHWLIIYQLIILILDYNQSQDLKVFIWMNISSAGNIALLFVFALLISILRYYFN